MEKLKQEFTYSEIKKIKERNQKIDKVNMLMTVDRETTKTPQKIYYVNFGVGKLEEVVEFEDKRELEDLETF